MRYHRKYGDLYRVLYHPRMYLSLFHGYIFSHFPKLFSQNYCIFCKNSLYYLGSVTGTDEEDFIPSCPPADFIKAAFAAEYLAIVGGRLRCERQSRTGDIDFRSVSLVWFGALKKRYFVLRCLF